MTSSDNQIHQAGIRADGFTTVAQKTRNKPGNICNISSAGIHNSMPNVVGVRNSTSLPVMPMECKYILENQIGLLIFLSENTLVLITCFYTYD
jgi:hypothetical protein